MVATIADTRSLEAVGDGLLNPLLDGAIGGSDTPHSGTILVDGNLPEAVLVRLATDPACSANDLRVVSASPEKAKRLLPFFATPSATIYTYLTEASALCGRHFNSSHHAASAMRDLGASRVLITDGAGPVTDSGRDGTVIAPPPPVTSVRASGAGDSFVAAHIAAEMEGLDLSAALNAALQAAAAHVSQAAPP